MSDAIDGNTRSIPLAEGARPPWLTAILGGLMVTVETQAEADERVPQLQAIPNIYRAIRVTPRELVILDRVGAKAQWEHMTRSAIRKEWPSLIDLRGIDLVVVTDAEPMGGPPIEANWIRELRDDAGQCGSAFSLHDIPPAVMKEVARDA